MKFTDIENIFTEKVARYISEGWTISARTMSGSQGEISKIDLVKGKTLVRIWLERSTHGSILSDIYLDTVVLNVGTWIQEYKSSPRGYIDTVWLSDFDIKEQIVYYKISRYRDWYIGDLEEVRRLHAIQESRRESSYHHKPTSVEITSDKTREIATKYLKRFVKYKRVSQDDIRVYKSNESKTYSILYRGHRYKLH